jgi:iron complex outermembrane receptor protein
VLLVPAKPTSDFGGYVEGSLGNYDMRRIQAVVNVPLAENFRLRAGFDRQTRQGYINNLSGIGPRHFNDVNYWAARVSLVGDLTPNLENYLIVNFIDSDTHGALQKLNACAPNIFVGSFVCDQMGAAKAAGDGFYDVRQTFPNPRSHSREWQIVNTTTWRASDTLTIKNIASYGQQRQDFANSLLALQLTTPAIPQVPLPSYVFSYANISRYPHSHSADQETWTEEFQVQGNSADDRLKWQAGVYFEQSHSMTPASQIASVLISCTDPAALQCTDILGALFGVPVGSLQITRFSANYRSVGVYGQASYKLTDTLSVTGGLRYTWDRSRVDQTNAIVNFDFSTPLAPVCSQAEAAADCSTEFRQRSQKPTWLASLEYKPIADILVFGKYARGYRTGGITAVLPRKFATSSPEKVDDFELGLKADFRGAVRGYFNATGFYNNFSNQQLSLNLVDNPAVPGVAAPAIGIVNVGKSRIYGAEVEAGLIPFDGFSLSASYAYLNTRVRRITLPDLVGAPYLIDSSIVVGDVLLQAPKNKFSITARYTLPLDESIGEITIGGTFSHSDRSRTNYADRSALAPGLGPILDENLQPTTADQGIMSGSNLLNLNLDWKHVARSNVDLSLFATNVTKQKFRIYPTGTLGSLGFEATALSEPRIYGARVRYSF